MQAHCTLLTIKCYHTTHTDEQCCVQLEIMLINSSTDLSFITVGTVKAHLREHIPVHFVKTNESFAPNLLHYFSRQFITFKNKQTLSLILIFLATYLVAHGKYCPLQGNECRQLFILWCVRRNDLRSFWALFQPWRNDKYCNCIHFYNEVQTFSVTILKTYYTVAESSCLILTLNRHYCLLSVYLIEKQKELKLVDCSSSTRFYFMWCKIFDSKWMDLYLQFGQYRILNFKYCQLPKTKKTSYYIFPFKRI